MSILSYPDRGHWGSSNWRGNCSGHVYKELLERLRPSLFVDPMVGSGTSIEVAKELKIEAVGLDLHSGFNILRDSIVQRVGREADFVCSHPPYGSMIRYSGNQWGDKPHADDLSWCADDEDFHEKLQIALLNQREATCNGGIYATIIGDMRKDGQYTSFQAEAIARMPKELLGVLIKAQHNTQSERKTYGRLSLPFITHEYIILWKKRAASTFLLLSTMANDQARRLRGTWKAIIRNVMMALGGQSDLASVYDAVSKGCPERIRENPNWKAKVRQVLNSTDDYRSVERGVWALA